MLTYLIRDTRPDINGRRLAVGGRINTVIFEYAERMNGMFEMAKIIPYPNNNNEEYHEAAWDTRNITYKEDITHNEIKDGLPTVIYCNLL